MNGFSRALPIILENEGGFSSHPDDPGGNTMRGITAETFDAWLADHGQPSRPVREITEDEVAAVYHERYWTPAHCTEWSWPLDLAVFDAAVNHGPKRAIRLLQKATGSNPDGAVGPKTRAAVEGYAPVDATRRLSWERAEFYAKIVRDRPASASFILGWIRRVRGLTEVEA